MIDFGLLASGIRGFSRPAMPVIAASPFQVLSTVMSEMLKLTMRRVLEEEGKQLV